jgi:hypothetical protein
MTEQQPRAEVCTWAAWHAAELSALGIPSAMALTVSAWFWAVTAASGAGWAVHEVRQQHRRRALNTTTREQVTSTDDTASSETTAASGAAREGA